MLQATSFHFLGWALLITACAELAPLLTAFGFQETGMVLAFTISAVVTAFAGGALILSTNDLQEIPGRQTLFILPLVIWLIVPAFAGIPYLYRNFAPGIVDGYFEAVSGFTTTGATIFPLPELLPKSLLVWRAMTQWLGGFATLTLVVGLFPLMGMAGMTLFESAVYYRDQRVLSVRLKALVTTIGWVYLMLTFVCFVSLAVARIPVFDAFCLALSTISTGGFMPTSAPLSAYDSRIGEAVLIVFMMLGAINMTSVWALMSGKSRPFMDDSEKVLGLVILGGAIFCLTVLAVFQDSEVSALSKIWSSIFSAVSMLTTTGFSIQASSDVGLFPALIFIVLVLIGGGFGSTAGGLKLMRVGVLLRQALTEIVKLAHPRGIFRNRFAGKRIEEDVILAIWAFFALFVLGVILLMIVLTLFGLPFDDAWAVAISTLSNAGPAANSLSQGAFVGYASLPDASKWAISIGMVVGRLELFPFMIIFSRFFWRH